MLSFGMLLSDNDLELSGGDAQCALQHAVWTHTAEATTRPGLFHGGRLIGIDDLVSLGDGEVSRLYNALGAVIVKFLPAGEASNFLERFAGPDRRFTGWDVFIGAEAAREAAGAYVDGFELPAGWGLSVLAVEAPVTVITEIQTLQKHSGVAPVPGYYQRGQAVPAVVGLLTDEAGAIVATAQAYERHHAESPWAGYIFVGMVAVHPEHRRKGFGTLINTFAISNAFAALNCTHVYEHARADNLPSRGMIKAGGLCLDTRYRCVMFHDARRFGEEFTK